MVLLAEGIRIQAALPRLRHPPPGRQFHPRDPVRVSTWDLSDATFLIYLLIKPLRDLDPQ